MQAHQQGGSLGLGQTALCSCVSMGWWGGTETETKGERGERGETETEEERGERGRDRGERGGGETERLA